MAAKIFRINYKSDFILTLNSDAGWMTPFCIKFWTGAPSQAFYVGWDGTTYTHCDYDPSEPTKLVVQFDDHHLPIGDLKFQIAYHFTVADFPNDTEDEVINPANITTEIDGQEYQVMLDFTGETSPEIQFSLPAYANEAQRIANEQQRIANEQQRIQDEETRIAHEETRQENEAQRIAQETARVNEFATLKSQSQAATRDANDAATLANQKAEYAQQQGGYAKDQGDYAKNQGDYAKEQGDTALADHQRAEVDHTQAGNDHTRAESDHGIAVDDHTQAGTDHTRAESDHGIAVDDHTQAGSDHTRAESDHGIAVDDHTQAGSDHTRAESDHGIAVDDHTQAGTDHQTAAADHQTAGADHTQAGNDHTRAESDHTRAESDHAAVEVYVDSLGAFDISAYHATGGVLAKYADLTAALGTNGANIPDALRKGGMSVKFVLSSDNKYVQYRLMTDSFSTTESDWQGVDDEPNAWSENLSNSGGVYANEKTLENKVFTSIKYTAAAGDPSNTPGQITDLETRCYVILNPNTTNTISVPEGFLIAVYGLNDGRDGQWVYRSGAWVQTYAIENWAYTQIGVKIRKTTATDTISESERKDILTVINNGSLETELKEDITGLQSDVNDIALDLKGDIAGLQSEVDNIASGQEDLEEIIDDGNKKIGFESGDFNTETGAIVADNTRGHAILNASNVKRIYAKGGFAVCAYGNNVPQLAGCTYKKSWASILDLSNWNYPYIIVKLRKRTPSASIDDSELADSAYCEIISARSDMKVMQEDKNEPHVLQMVSGDIDNGALTAGTTSSNIAASDNTRGFNIISALNVDKIQTKDGFLVCAYSVDVFGLVNGVYRKAWANTLDLSNYPYNFIAIKVRKTNAQDVISDDELMNCVEVYTVTTSDTTNLVEEIISPQVTDNDNYHSLTNKLIAGKKYKIELEFDGFQSSDFANLTSPAKFITYYLTQSKVDEVNVSLFNGGTMLKTDGVNTLLYVPTSDVFYFRLSSVFKPDVLGDYSKKVKMKAYLMEEEGMLTKPEIDIKNSIGINVFGDVLPPLFKEKLLNLDEDLLITCVGDSLTGAVNWSGQVEDPTHEPAGHQFTDWVSQLLSIVNKNKPQNDRLDSKRSGSDVFTKTGTWNITNYDTFSGKNDPNKQHPDGEGRDMWFGDFSISAQTFRSSDNNAQVQFVWDLDAHAKCNIVTAKSIDGVLSQVVIAEGNGKALVSEDRENWVEANGYQFLQRSNPTGKTDAELAEAGEAKYERHRRLWMKKVEGATGTITVTYKRDNSTSYSSSYMYFWGIERYSYPAIFIDNLGRGGRPTSVLVMNTSDIFDRHPDLVLYEMPIANEQDQYQSVMKERYRLYFLSDNDNSFKTKSNNYQDVPVLLMLPHCRSQYFDDNNSAIIYTGAGGQNENLPAYLMEKQVYGWLKDQMSSIQNAKLINLLDYMLDESIKNFGRINVALGGDIPYGYTVDTIHLSKYGAQKYVKYLAPIFYI